MTGKTITFKALSEIPVNDRPTVRAMSGRSKGEIVTWITDYDWWYGTGEGTGACSWSSIPQAEFEIVEDL